MLRFFFFFFFLSTFVNAANELDSLIVKLDFKMGERALYDKNKEKLIGNYKEIIKDSLLDVNAKFQITKKLIYELEYYSFDAALYYTLKNLEVAKSLNAVLLIVDSKILLAKLLMESGRYKESLDILNDIDRKKIPKELLSSYFSSLQEGYSELSYYSSIPKNKQKYYWLHKNYQDSLVAILPNNSDELLRLKEKEFRDKRQLDKALKINDQRLLDKKSGTRIYSLITFERSLLYELADNRNLEKKYLILSSISDIEASVKDNASLAKLAMRFYEEKKIFKAHKYINFSLDDAKFFNSKLRFINLSNILPVITEAYERENRLQNKKLMQSLAFISVLALFLLMTIFFIYRQYKKLSLARGQLDNANAALKNLNMQLNDSNHNLHQLYQELLQANTIKEKYIGTFLNLYSDYINKLDMYRKLVKKYVTLNKVDELKKLSKSTQVVDSEMKLFHKNFDESFLEIYPNFITEFNKLLLDDKKVTVKKQDALNTELRIYALIRLGITKSEQIAKILRYSVSTIYNYRVKLKNSAKNNRDTFEDEVKKIL